ncbi:MAG: hypothetical protein LAT84_06970 [Balneolia bacterium]|nr:hypothetical protein [Balneolia bacterium]
MKVKIVLASLFVLFTAGFFLLIFTTERPQTPPSTSADYTFELDLELTEDSFTFSNAKGFNLTNNNMPLSNISVSIPNDRRPIIGEWGIVMDHTQSDSDSTRIENADFAFQVFHEDGTVSMESLKGTNWKSVSFTCRNTPCKHKVTNMGISRVTN